MTLRSCCLLCMLALPALAQVEGTWDLVQAPDLEAQVAAATKGLRPAEADRARRRLQVVRAAPRRITLRHAGGRFHAEAEGEPALDVPDTGRAVPWTGPDGGTYLAAVRREGKALVQTLMGEDGMRAWTYRLEGPVLRVRVESKGLLLRRPLVYTLVYRRAPAEGGRR